MKREFGAYPLKAMICFVIVAVTALLGGCLVYMGRPGSALVFFIIGLLFFFVSVPYASIITVSEEGITKHFWGLERLSLSWEEIAEVGIAGLKVFNGNDRKKTGTLCIYFSPKKLTEAEHFEMLLRWPVKEIPFMVYDSRRLEAVQLCWGRRITYYNAGDVKHYMIKDGLK